MGPFGFLGALKVARDSYFMAAVLFLRFVKTSSGAQFVTQALAGSEAGRDTSYFCGRGLVRNNVKPLGAIVIVTGTSVFLGVRGFYIRHEAAFPLYNSDDFRPGFNLIYDVLVGRAVVDC